MPMTTSATVGIGGIQPDRVGQAYRRTPVILELPMNRIDPVVQPIAVDRTIPLRRRRAF